MYQKKELVKLTLIRLYQEIINFLKFFFMKKKKFYLIYFILTYILLKFYYFNNIYG